MTPDWNFIVKRPGQGLKGADPLQHAVDDLDINNLVRESVQNSNDEILDEVLEEGGRGQVIFSVKNLEGAELNSFKQNLDWPRFSGHLQSQGKTTDTGERTRSYLESVEEKEEMLLLKIEDINCTGLVGAEEDIAGESNFANLVRNVGMSDKRLSGGSWGIGKTVYWAFSGIQTVLFNSVLSRNRHFGKDNPRFIGASDLSSHKYKEPGESAEKIYLGEGHFGKTEETGDGVMCASIWGQEAEDIAEDLFVSHAEDPGTSITIAGFDHPRKQREYAPEELISLIEQNAEKYFWPAIVQERLDIYTESAESGKGRVSPESSEWAPFLDCYRRFLEDDAEDKLESPGDIITSEINFEIPAKDGEKEKTREVAATLLVRLAHESEPHTGKLARFRGSGMIIDEEYQDHGDIIGADDFHAVLVCGRARNPDSPSEIDDRLEEFLIAAEPVSHNEWTSTPHTKSKYSSSGTTYINRFEKKVRERLRGILVGSAEEAEEGPSFLEKRFPLGIGGGGARGKEKVSLVNPDVNYVDGGWKIKGKIRLRSVVESAEVVLKLVEQGEDGARYDPIEMERFSIAGDYNAEAAHEDGEVNISITEEREVSFHGMTKSVPQGRVELIAEMEGNPYDA